MQKINQSCFWGRLENVCGVCDHCRDRIYHLPISDLCVSVCTQLDLHRYSSLSFTRPPSRFISKVHTFRQLRVVVVRTPKASGELCQKGKQKTPWNMDFLRGGTPPLFRLFVDANVSVSGLIRSFSNIHFGGTATAAIYRLLLCTNDDNRRFKHLFPNFYNNTTRE